MTPKCCNLIQVYLVSSCDIQCKFTNIRKSPITHKRNVQYSREMVVCFVDCLYYQMFRTKGSNSWQHYFKMDTQILCPVPQVVHFSQSMLTRYLMMAMRFTEDYLHTELCLFHGLNVQCTGKNNTLKFRLVYFTKYAIYACRSGN